MSDRSDDVTRGVILGYLMVSNPVFAIGYLVSGLPWWIWALAALVGVVVALVWFLMWLAAEVRALALRRGRRIGWPLSPASLSRGPIILSGATRDLRLSWRGRLGSRRRFQPGGDRIPGRNAISLGQWPCPPWPRGAWGPEQRFQSCGRRKPYRGGSSAPTNGRLILGRRWPATVVFPTDPQCIPTAIFAAAEPPPPICLSA
jgi:hypothetical protein